MSTSHTLPNGLTVLLDEHHSAPVAAVLTHVRTGYFDEDDRHAGISHLLEHMFFKGTPTRPGPEDIARATKALGGTLNAFTYYEETGYYCVAPSDRLKDALAIQSDALLNALVDPGELATETEVVIQEARQKKDSPWAFATESLFALAFQQHRMRRWRIGEPEVLRALTRDDVMTYYRGRYAPKNITLVVSGDFDSGTALERIEALYRFSDAAPYDSPGPEELPQVAPRRRQMRADIRQRIALMGWHTVPALHDDAYALDILSAVLADGRSSRLFRNVRERGVATAVQASQMSFRDVGFFLLAAESLGENVAATEDALWNEVSRLAREPPAPEEMERIRTRIRARWTFDSEEALGRARRLAAFQALGDYRLAEEWLGRLLAVTPEDVSRVAAAYFTPERANVLEYVPEGSGVPDTGQATWLPSAAAPDDRSPEPVAPVSVIVPAPAPGVALPAERRDWGGHAIAARSCGTAPVVAVEMTWPGGRLQETLSNAGMTNLMLRAAMKGTRRLSASALAASFEALGSSLEPSQGPDAWGFSFRVLADRLPAAMKLAADVALHPVFPAAEVDREREALLAEIRRAQDSGLDTAVDLLYAAGYERHPYGLPDRGEPDAIASITPEGLAEWHQARVAGPAVVTAAGAVDVEGLAGLVGDLFPPVASDVRNPLPESAAWRGGEERAETRDRAQTAAALGFPTVDVSSDDRYALDVIAQVVSGLGGRFFAEVRGRQGLAYTVSSWHAARRCGGVFVTYTSTSPDNEVKARDSLLAEFRRLTEEPVSAEEIGRAKAYLVGTLAIALQTSTSRARELSRNLLYGRPLEAAEEYVARVKALHAEDLLRVARRYFEPGRHAVGALRGSPSRAEGPRG